MKVSPIDNVCDEERELDAKLEKRKRELVEVGEPCLLVCKSVVLSEEKYCTNTADASAV